MENDINGTYFDMRVEKMCKTVFFDVNDEKYRFTS